jgi:hypothetical protein
VEAIFFLRRIASFFLFRVRKGRKAGRFDDEFRRWLLRTLDTTSPK